MKLKALKEMIYAIIKNDLKFLRPWLFLWGGILLAVFLLFAAMRTPLGWNEDYWDFLKWAFLLLFLGQLLCQVLLITRIIQKENLFTPRAYWLTRPLPRTQLFGAKILLLAGVIFLPQLLQFALAGACFPGGWDGALNGMKAITILSLLVCLPTVVGASLTKESGQALLAIFLIPIALVLSGSILARFLGSISGLGQLLEALGESRLLQFLVLLIGGALLLGSFWRHFRSPLSRWPHRLRYLTSLALLLVGATMTPSRAIPKSTISLPEESELRVDNLNYGIEESSLFGLRSSSNGNSAEIWKKGGERSKAILQAKPTWQGLPKDLIAKVEPLRSSSPQGQRLQLKQGIFRSFRFDGVSEAYLQSLFPGTTIKSVATRGLKSQTLFASSSLLKQEVPLPADFSTVFETRLYRGHKTQIELLPTRRVEVNKTRMLLVSAQNFTNSWKLTFKFFEGNRGTNRVSSPFQEGIFILKEPTTNEVSVGIINQRSAVSMPGLGSTGEVMIDFRGLGRETDFSKHELYFVEQELVGVDIREVKYEVTPAP